MNQIKNKLTSEVHFQHQLWKHSLDFYKQELHFFQDRLEEVASKNSGMEVKTGIEQFQNMFLIQHNELGFIWNAIEDNEVHALLPEKINLRRVDYQTSAEYTTIAKEMDQFEKIYKELKADYFRFLAKWM